MTISIQNRLSEQHKEQTFMPTQTATAITNANQNQEQFMNYPTANFLMTSPAKTRTESIIIQNEHGVLQVNHRGPDVRQHVNHHKRM